MENLFNSIPARKPPRNFFSLSHEVKGTSELMLLTPVMCERMVPGDRAKDNTEILMRMLATTAPIMHRINIYTHFFRVDERLLWNDWEKFISGGKDGTYNVKRPLCSLSWLYALYQRTSTSFKNKYALASIFGLGSLLDYFGFPVQLWMSDSLNVDQSALAGKSVPVQPFTAFYKIFTDYYSDETYGVGGTWDDVAPILTDVQSWTQDPSKVSSDVADIIVGCFVPRYRSWEHDYFTSALPWQQRGPEVTIPISSSEVSVNIPNLPVNFQAKEPVPYGGLTGNPRFVQMSSGLDYDIRNNVVWQQYETDGNSNFRNPVIGVGTPGSEPLSRLGVSAYDPAGTLVTGRTSVPLVLSSGELLLQELRRTMKVQLFFENDARGGFRYPEVLQSHFGVRPSDSSLQRARYLGGGISPLVISQVANTSSGDSSNPQGNLAGVGISRQRTHQFNHFFNEHSWLIGIMSIMPKPGYMQSVRREFYAQDRFQYYWPEFGNLGEQPIQSWELDMSAMTSDVNIDDSENPFGYTPRYAEYKTRMDTVCGQFRSSLKFWHLAREFDKTPVMGDVFLTTPPNGDRIFATAPDGPYGPGLTQHFLFQIYHNLKMIRPMSKYGTPTF